MRWTVRRLSRVRYKIDRERQRRDYSALELRRLCRIETYLLERLLRERR